ncbi:MAG: hypothetical protein KF752_20005 [Pirellulaceae bacterium]|nr:hypothetical protein [Pirellulaceae bacterium]
MTQQVAITSSHNPFFRYCLRLRLNRQRRKAGQFLIDGTAEIARAHRGGIQLLHLLVDGDQQLDDSLAPLLGDSSAVQIHTLSRPLMDKLSYGQADGRPIAVAQEPELLLDRLSLQQHSLILVLDRTEKPGNLGACMRSAAACGVDAVVLTDPICDPFNANAIRASRGTMFRTPLAQATCEQFLMLAASIELPVFAARVQSHVDLWQLDLSRGGAIVLGNESQGLGPDWQRELVTDFRIPMSDRADSLNLSISAAVTLYESVRQRGGPQN